jgi:hypothetical protein
MRSSLCQENDAFHYLCFVVFENDAVPCAACRSYAVKACRDIVVRLFAKFLQSYGFYVVYAS